MLEIFFTTFGVLQRDAPLKQLHSDIPITHWTRKDMIALMIRGTSTKEYSRSESTDTNSSSFIDGLFKTTRKVGG
jgi:hypothetical protein